MLILLALLLTSLKKSFVGVASKSIWSFILVSLLLLVSLSLSAQQPIQVIWPLTSDGEAVYSAGIGSAVFTPGPGVQAFSYDTLNGATSTGWNSRNLNPNVYYEYTIVPERDATIELRNLNFEVSLSLVNMRTAVHYSKDGFTKQSVPVTGNIYVGKKSSRNLQVETSITVSYPETLSIRIYGWSAPTPAVSFFTREVEFSGIIRGPMALPQAFNVTGGGSYCSGGTGVIINLSGSELGVNYELMLGGVPTGNIQPGTGALISFLNVTSPGLYTIRGTNVEGTTLMNGSATVSIWPLPVATATPPSQAICSGASTSIVLSSSVGGTTYTWTVAQLDVTGAAAGSGANINQTLNATTSSQGTATYTVTPVANGCTGSTIDVIVSVNPIPDVTITPLNQTICSGETTSMALTSSVTGTTYSWTVTQSGVSGASAASGSTIAQTLTATGTTPGTATYVVTPNAAGCNGGTRTSVVTVKPRPTVSTSPATQTACPGKDITDIVLTNPNGIPGTTYSWTRSYIDELTGLESGTGSPIEGIINSTAPGSLFTTVFTITATSNGCSSNTTASVTVGDVTAPDVTCNVSGTQNVTTNTACTYVHSGTTWNATVVENCEIVTLTYTLSGATIGSGSSLAGIAFNLGTTTVTWTVTDIAGLTDQCTFNVAVTDDDPPVITCQGNQTAGTNTGCNYVHSGTTWDATATDNCGTPVLTWALTGATTGSGNTTLSGVTFNKGVTRVTWTATAGGLTITCFHDITVNDDDPPVISCTGNQAVNTNTNCTYVHSGTGWNATATDNCTYTLSYTLTGATTGTGTSLNGVAFNKGVTTVTWTATDGITPVTCQFAVTVTDIIAPTFTTCPGPVTAYANGANCETKISIAQPVSNDNCTGTILTWSITGATPAATGTGFLPNNYTFWVGLTTLTYTATDASGNTATCVIPVTVFDNRPPDITCPIPAASYPNDPGLCSASLTFAATATDNCGVSYIEYKVNGNVITFPYAFPVGSTIVTAIAYDFNNNSAPCTFNVTVVDTEVPTITCVPSPQQRDANNGTCTYTVIGTEFDPLSYGDNCNGSTIRNSFNNLATLNGAVLPQGVTNITWTVTAANLQTTTCTFTVRVNDGQAPTLTCPANIIENTSLTSTICGKNVTWVPPIPSDNCVGAVTLTCSHINGSIFPVGVTTVTYTATDGSLNSFSCTFTITVIDLTPPNFNISPTALVNTDANCLYNIDPSITGNPTSVTDNCAIASTTYTDAAPVPGACNGSYTITRIWRVTDVNGNFTEKTQVITVQDKTAPLLVVPANKIVDCADPIASYGTATATDNCDTNPVITFTDAIVNDPNCPSGKTITRTWTATDCSGNVASGIQTITVDDNIPPVIDNTGNTVVNCPNQIPDPDITTIVAHDNCGPVTVVYDYDDAQFPPAAPGYCPDYINRYYNVFDQCGNKTVAIQYIDILNPLAPVCECAECLSNNSFYAIDFREIPSGTITIPNAPRLDKCCDATKQEQCVSFSVYIPAGAVGIQILVDGGHPNGSGGGNNFWKVDCEEIEFLENDFVCLEGDNYYLFTYCKPGQNENNSFTFTIMQGLVTAPDITARVSCNSQLTVNTNATGVTWNSISPGTPGQYNGYLSCTNCLNPTFTPDANAPNIIVYEVCGTMANMPCYSQTGFACETVTVYVLEEITVTFDVDPGAYCNDAIPPITATITPTGTTYQLSWYKLPDLTTVLGTQYTFLPPSAGDYVLKVFDMDDGVPCPEYFYYFTVAPDDQEPVVTAPAPLILECENPNNLNLINDWLASATAIDDHDPTLAIINNYTGITQDCNSTVTITFSATDHCDNTGYATSTITIHDTGLPTWLSSEGDLNSTIECSDAAGLHAANLLVPQATDLCDESVIITKTAGALVPGSCPQAGTITNTFIATDACGNITAVPYIQIITITDANAPSWTTLAGELNRNVSCSDAAGLAAAQALMPAATDICDPTVTITKTAGAQVGGVCPVLYTYTNTFIATDDCGNNSVIYTQLISVTDVDPPVITIPASNIIVECDGSGNTAQLNAWLASNGGAVATDACVAVTWTNNYTSLSNECGATGSATVLFTASDGCNNIATTTATFTITDTQAPTISCPGNATAIVDPGTCEVTGVVLGMATATDNCSAPGEITITNDAPATFPGGVTIVTWTATDACGNAITCEQTVTVEDDIDPTINCPPSITVTAPEPECEMEVLNIEYPEIDDNCDISLLTLSWVKTGATSGTGTGNVNNTVFNVGVTTVTYTVTDSWDNTATCSFTVTVNDEVPPEVIDCHNATINVNNNPGECFATVVIETPEAFDPCGETYTITNDYNNTSNASDDYPVGTTTVTWTIRDASGNETTCQVIVNVTDIEIPQITCPDDYETLITNGGCDLENVPVPDPVINENCGYTVTWEMTGATIGTGTGFVGGETFNIGITYVAYTIVDESGNRDECTFQVWIKNLDAPQFSVDCPLEIITAEAGSDCNANVIVPSPVIDNPCDELYTITNTSPYKTSNANASGTYPAGTTNFTWTITDASGNVTTCPQSVTVNDNIPPSLTCPPDAIDEITNGGCNMVPGTIQNPTYTDNCDDPNPNTTLTLTWQMFGATTGTSAATGINLVNGQIFNVGKTRVLYTLTDPSGNFDTCSFYVWIKNLDAPQFSVACPQQNITANAGANCDALVNVPAPGITNPCLEAYTVINNSPHKTSNADASGTYPVGTTTFTWTITDASGNVTTCPQSVTVIDNIPPSLTCPPDAIDEIINGGCDMVPATIGLPITTDNCDGGEPENKLTLTWQMFGATTGDSPTIGYNLVNGETFNIGITRVLYTLIDDAGNSDTCSFYVWIKNLSDPLFDVICPTSPITVSASTSACNAFVTVPPPTIINPCDEEYKISNNSPYGIPADGIYPVGTTLVTWEIIDASGNKIYCEQTIIVEDDIDPLLLCPPNQVVDADFELPYATGVVLGVPTYSDNCGILSLTWVHSATTPGSSPLTGINIDNTSTFNVGVTTITYTATDIHGNVTTCFFTITVISEPEITCPTNISTTTDPGVCSATLNPGGPTLISGAEPITWTYTITNGSTTIATGTCTTATLATCIGNFAFPVGVNTIYWTATNISGMDECIQTVTVTDDEAPTFTTQGPFEFCVVNIISAQYDDQPEPLADIIPLNPAHGNPRRPDWYLVATGSTELDLLNLIDNCCEFEDIIINWTITFDPIIGGALSGTGQPSLNTPIQLWGIASNMVVNHIIIYTVTDCNGNQATPVSRNILIKPRPNVIKQP